MRQSLAIRLLDNDWAGPGLISLMAIAVISILQPAFLSPFNILVLLSAIAVNMVVALGQLVIIGVGQMNLALGALGGLVAICFVGAIEVLGVPAPLAIVLGLLIGIVAGMANGVIIARTGISAFIITLASLQWNESRRRLPTTTAMLYLPMEWLPKHPRYERRHRPSVRHDT